MLKPSTPEAAECYARAQEARVHANSAQNFEMRAIYLDAEQRWLKLAASYEATARITQFLGDEPIVKHPICTSCGVAMWLVEVRGFSTDHKQYIYECKACNGRTEVDGKIGPLMTESGPCGSEARPLPLARKGRQSMQLLADQFRENADRCERQAAGCSSPLAKKTFDDLARQWRDLARQQDELDLGTFYNGPKKPMMVYR